jgi:hypothetical protein
MSAILYCERPHPKTVNFETARFIVGKSCGVEINGRHFYLGDEVPKGVLTTRALRELYELPYRRIETLEYAQRVPSLNAILERNQALREGYERLKFAVRDCESKPDEIDSLPHKDLVELCKNNGLKYNGKTEELRKRLHDFMAR